MHDLASFKGGRDWLRHLTNYIIISSADGGYSVNNTAYIVYDLANLGRRLAGEALLPALKDGAQFYFILPGSVYGFQATRNDLLYNLVEVRQVINKHGYPRLAIRLHRLLDTVDDVKVLTQTFILPDTGKIADNNIIVSPLLYPGQ